jgi:hypothetical protein
MQNIYDMIPFTNFGSVFEHLIILLETMVLKNLRTGSQVEFYGRGPETIA